MKILLCSTNEAVRKRWAAALQDKFELTQAVTLEEIAANIRTRTQDLLMIHRPMVTREHLQKICTLPDHPRLFILADRPDNNDGLLCFRIGCSGYANTYISSGRLDAALNSISQGLAWIGESLMQHILQGLAEPTEAIAQEEGPDLLNKLSPREKEIAMLIARGMSNAQISKELGITERTVKAHLSAIYSKTKTKGRLDLGLQMNSSKAKESAE